MSDTTQELRKQMADEARLILDQDGATSLIDGEENVLEIIICLIDAFPEAKKMRPEKPGYAFADFVNEFSARVTGGIIAGALRNTRGAIANRFEA